MQDNFDRFDPVNQAINQDPAQSIVHTETIARVQAQRNQSAGQVFHILLELRVGLANSLKWQYVTNIVPGHVCTVVDKSGQGGRQIRDSAWCVDVTFREFSNRSATICIWKMHLKTPEKNWKQKTNTYPAIDTMNPSSEPWTKNSQIDQSLYQSTNQSIDQTNNLPITQSTNQSINHDNNKNINQSMQAA